jgi:hypothetical protein
MKSISQKDPRWKNIPLGNSTLTIGTDGCLITSLASIADLNPILVNEALKTAGAFDGALVVWDKIGSAIPGIRLIKRNWTKGILPTGICLLEVDWDGSPTTDGRHWVVQTGDGYIMDPWTGTLESPNKYPLVTGWATFLIEGGEDEMKLTDKIPQEVKDQFNLVAYSEFNNNEETWESFIENWKAAITNINLMKKDKEDMIKNYENQLELKNEEILKFKEDLEKLSLFEEQIQTLQGRIVTLEDKVNVKGVALADVRSKLEKCEKTNNTLTGTNDLLKQQIKGLEEVVAFYKDNLTLKAFLHALWDKIRR